MTDLLKLDRVYLQQKKKKEKSIHDMAKQRRGKGKHKEENSIDSWITPWPRARVVRAISDMEAASNGATNHSGSTDLSGPRFNLALD